MDFYWDGFKSIFKSKTTLKLYLVASKIMFGNGDLEKIWNTFANSTCNFKFAYFVLMLNS